MDWGFPVGAIASVSFTGAFRFYGLGKTLRPQSSYPLPRLARPPLQKNLRSRTLKSLGEAMQVSLTAQQNPELPVAFVAASLPSMSKPREGTLPFAPRSGAREN